MDHDRLVATTIAVGFVFAENLKYLSARMRDGIRKYFSPRLRAFLLYDFGDTQCAAEEAGVPTAKLLCDPGMKSFAALMVVLIPGPVLAGTTMPSYPDGMSSLQETCIADAQDMDHPCDYSVNVLADHQGLPRFVVAERKMPKDGPEAYWQITDTLPYPAIGDGYELVIGTCQENETSDATIIAVVKTGNGEWLGQATWARRIDLRTGKFSGMTPAAVRCINETGDPD